MNRMDDRDCFSSPSILQIEAEKFQIVSRRINNPSATFINSILTFLFQLRSQKDVHGTIAAVSNEWLVDTNGERISSEREETSEDSCTGWRYLTWRSTCGSRSSRDHFTLVNSIESNNGGINMELVFQHDKYLTKTSWLSFLHLGVLRFTVEYDEHNELE